MDNNIGQDIHHLFDEGFVVVVRVTKARGVNHLKFKFNFPQPLVELCDFCKDFFS